MKKEDLEKILAESESVKSAVEHGVPLKGAVKIYLTANRLVEEGKWVQIYANKTVRSKDIPQCTSVVRYWGSKELLSEVEKDPDKFSLDRFKKMYRAGLLGKTVEEISSVGKTHELVLGSSIFPEEEWLRSSVPEEGRKVYHRHWEIKEMYHYAKKRLNKHLLGFFFSISSLMFVFFFLQTPSITGSAVIKTSKIDTTFFVFILSGISVVLLILLLFKKRINFMKGRL